MQLSEVHSKKTSTSVTKPWQIRTDISAKEDTQTADGHMERRSESRMTVIGGVRLTTVDTRHTRENGWNLGMCEGHVLRKDGSTSPLGCADTRCYSHSAQASAVKVKRTTRSSGYSPREMETVFVQKPVCECLLCLCS